MKTEARKEVSRLPQTKSYFALPVVRQAMFIFVIVMVLLGGLYYFLKDEGLPVKQTSSAPTETADDNLIFSQGALVEKQDGKDIWQLSAETIETNLRAQKTRLVKVSGTFYGTAEKNSAVHLTADTALLDNTTRNIAIRDNVKISGSEAVLSAPAAEWDSKARKFTAVGGIDLRRGDMVLTGESVVVDPDLETVTVTGRARLVKGVSKNET